MVRQKKQRPLMSSSTRPHVHLPWGVRLNFVRVAALGMVYESVTMGCFLLRRSFSLACAQVLQMAKSVRYDLVLILRPQPLAQ